MIDVQGYGCPKIKKPPRQQHSGFSLLGITASMLEYRYFQI